jgi:hypothetical protein
VPEFFETMADKRDEYERDYKPELERRIREREEEGKTEGLSKLMKDINVKGDMNVKGKQKTGMSKCIDS